jgi:glycerate dehydrogenase
VNNLMKIVILDAHTTNPGDLSWDPLARLGDLAVHDRTAPTEVLQRAADADAVITNKTLLDGDLLAALPRLRYVGLLSTGTNAVDLTAASRLAITVTNVPGYSTPGVAQAVFALLLELTNRTGHHADEVRSGRWSRSPDFCWWDGELVELEGLTLGVVGFGAIGRRVAAIGQAFGMRTIAATRSLPAGTVHDGVTIETLDGVFREADVVSLHCPLTAETEALVDARRLSLMKPTAYLINTARGGLVVEADLAAALRDGRLAGAGLDVLSREPPPVDNPLLTAPRCVISPHVAWATRKARGRLIEEVAANVRGFLEGSPRNVVT